MCLGVRMRLQAVLRCVQIFQYRRQPLKVADTLTAGIKATQNNIRIFIIRKTCAVMAMAGCEDARFMVNSRENMMNLRGFGFGYTQILTHIYFQYFIFYFVESGFKV